MSTTVSGRTRDRTGIILFFFFPVDLTGAEFFLFLLDLVVGPSNTGEAPRSFTGSSSACAGVRSTITTESGVWNTDSGEVTDMELVEEVFEVGQWPP